MLFIQTTIVLLAMSAAYLGRQTCGTTRNPVLLVSLWWLAWLMPATLGIAGLDAIAPRTAVLYLLMIAGFQCGFLLGRNPLQRQAPRRPPGILQRNLQVILPVLATMLAAYSLFLLGEAVRHFGGSIFNATRTETTDLATVYGSNPITGHFASHLARPLTLFTATAATYLFWKDNKTTLPLIAVSAVAFQALIRLGRVDLYRIALITLVFGILIPATMRRRAFSRLTIAVLLTMCAAAVFGMTVISDVRYQGLEISSTSEFLRYHTLGFVLLDKELVDPTSLTRTTQAWGRASLNGLVSFLLPYIQQVSPTASVPNYPLVLMRQLHLVTVGADAGTVIRGNAFYTMLHTLYVDGRDIGVFLMPLVYGYSLRKVYRRALSSGDPGNWLWTGLLVYLGLFSLFTPLLEESDLWGMAAALWLFGAAPMYRLIPGWRTMIAPTRESVPAATAPTRWRRTAR